jgi:hypothetical protein
MRFVVRNTTGNRAARAMASRLSRACAMATSKPMISSAWAAIATTSALARAWPTRCGRFALAGVTTLFLRVRGTARALQDVHRVDKAPLTAVMELSKASSLRPGPTRKAKEARGTRSS